jgi:hypothetical protein
VLVGVAEEAERDDRGQLLLLRRGKFGDLLSVAWSFRKSKKIGPLRLNLGKRSGRRERRRPWGSGWHQHARPEIKVSWVEEAVLA